MDTRLLLWLRFNANTWWTWRTNECSSFEVRHLGYQLRCALRARKMSNSAINPSLVVIRALISKLRLEIYGFILCYVNRSLLMTQNASLNISLFLIMTSTSFWTTYWTTPFQLVSLNCDDYVGWRRRFYNIECSNYRNVKSRDTFSSYSWILIILTSNNKLFGSTTFCCVLYFVMFARW